MFGDIAGFTAWSSTREPFQVFTLSETIYHEFDMIAKRRQVFKVEVVVGDFYVAITGLPDPPGHHAIVSLYNIPLECRTFCLFAFECAPSYTYSLSISCL